MPILISSKHLLLITLLIASTAIMLFGSSQTHAEYLGLPSGRSADIPSLPSSSFEAGFVTGDIGEASYQSIVGRFNLRLSDVLMAYFDLAQTDVEKSDGLGFGAGFFYHVPGILKNSDFAVKVSYHTVGLEQSNSNNEFDVNVLSFEGLLSGQNIGESSLRWYTNLGIHKFDSDDNYDDTELGFGAGAISDTSFGEFYGGVDIIDELTFGLGVRYHLQ